MALLLTGTIALLSTLNSRNGLRNETRRLSRTVNYTNFQAETYALLVCAQENLWVQYFNQRVLIYSDSQGVLKPLASCLLDSELVLGSLKAINQLVESNKVHICWVPGHQGLPGNDKAADAFAR